MFTGRRRDSRDRPRVWRRHGLLDAPNRRRKCLPHAAQGRLALDSSKLLIEFGDDSLVRLLPLAHDGCLGCQLHRHLIIRIEQLGGLRGAELRRLPVYYGGKEERGPVRWVEPGRVGALSSTAT